MIVKKIKWLLIGLGLVLFAFFAFGVYWINAPFTLTQPKVLFNLKKGTRADGVAQQIKAAGVNLSPLMFNAYIRLTGQARYLQAGTYDVTTGETPQSLLRKMVKGDSVTFNLTLIDGWTFDDVRHALNAAPDLIHETLDLSDAQIMAELGRAHQSPEAMFFPDTYSYLAQDSDLDVLKRAMKRMDEKLEQVWQARADHLPLRSKQDLRIMASLVQQESALASERPMVAAVLGNRLAIGMRLQTDPTVIYGLGSRYRGQLTKRDLERDTPWNTYLHTGLPPTPIALTCLDALQAAAHPANSSALYFVAKGTGDGKSEFSDNLASHNQAVARYRQRERQNKREKQRE